MNSFISLSNQLKMFDEIKQSIFQLSTKTSEESIDVKKLIEKFDGSSLSIQNTINDINN